MGLLTLKWLLILTSISLTTAHQKATEVEKVAAGEKETWVSLQSWRKLSRIKRNTSAMANCKIKMSPISALCLLKFCILIFLRNLAVIISSVHDLYSKVTSFSSRVFLGCSPKAMLPSTKQPRLLQLPHSTLGKAGMAACQGCWRLYSC